MENNNLNVKNLRNKNLKMSRGNADCKMGFYTTRVCGMSPLFLSAFLFAFIFEMVPRAQAEMYRYNPANKVDPFSPLPLLRPSIKGVTRLQDYELSELELIGTIMASEVSALIMTPDPREGILSKVGDRIGKHGGTIIAVSRNKIVVREPSASLIPGVRGKFTDTTMNLSQPKKKDGEKEKSISAGADNANSKLSGTSGSANFPGLPPPSQIPSFSKSSVAGPGSLPSAAGFPSASGFKGVPALPPGESE